MSQPVRTSVGGSPLRFMDGGREIVTQDHPAPVAGGRTQSGGSSMASQGQPQIDPSQLAGLMGGDPYGQGGGGGMPPGGGQPMQPMPQAGMPSGPGAGPGMPPGGAMMDALGQQQGGGSPTDQAVWQTFPSTDPNMVQQMFGPGGDPGAIGQGMLAYQQASEQDMMQLQEKQRRTLAAVVQQLMAPPASAAVSQAGPGTGGEGTGYTG